MSVSIQVGNKQRKFKSIREASKVLDIPYMTLYMRVYHGWNGKSLKRKVRTYSRQNTPNDMVAA